jgi:hypothetical protein
MNEMTRYRPNYNQLSSTPAISKINMKLGTKRPDVVKPSSLVSFDNIDKRVSKKSLIKLAEMVLNLPKEASPPKRVKKLTDSESEMKTINETNDDGDEDRSFEQKSTFKKELPTLSRKGSQSLVSKLG